MSTKDERDAIRLAIAKADLRKAMEGSKVERGQHTLTEGQRQALVTAAKFVYNNGGIMFAPDEVNKDLLEGIKVLSRGDA